MQALEALIKAADKGSSPPYKLTHFMISEKKPQLVSW